MIFRCKINDTLLVILGAMFLVALVSISVHDAVQTPDFEIIDSSHDSVTIKERYYFGLLSSETYKLYVLRYRRGENTVIEYVHRNGHLYRYNGSLKDALHEERDVLDRIDRTRAFFRNRTITTRN